MLEGEGDHLVEDGDPIRIRAGDLVYIPAGEWHGFRNSSDALVRMVGINEGVTHYMDSGYEDHPASSRRERRRRGGSDGEPRRAARR